MDTTTTAITVTDGATAALGSLAPAVEAAQGYAAGAFAPKTLEAYRAQWTAFVAWASEHGLEPLPAAPSTIALYLADRAKAGRKVATLALALASIVAAHRRADHPSPRSSRVVREVWAGIRRDLGVAQRRAAPAVVDEIRAMVDALPATLSGQRDRALLVLGFAGAFRRSEIVALDVADLAFTTDGLVVTVRRSKTDQVAAGETVGLPYGANPATCPVRSVRAWLDAAGIVEGVAFRSVDRHGRVGGALDGRDVARIVKRSAEGAGLDASGYSGHSLRAGLATTAATVGKGDRAIMRQGRWRSRAMVDRYVREASLFRENAAGGIGL